VTVAVLTLAEILPFIETVDVSFIVFDTSGVSVKGWDSVRTLDADMVDWLPVSVTNVEIERDTSEELVEENESDGVMVGLLVRVRGDGEAVTVGESEAVSEREGERLAVSVNVS
jgi:hypothetical protein